MYSRNVPAMDTKTAPPIWKLTTAQWAVYYWLLAHSNRNPNGQERHYYIYRNSFTITKICADTGIKTSPTVRSAFAKLIEVGAMTENLEKTAYQLVPPRIFIPMNASIILGLLGFHKYIDPGVTITTFAILARLDKFRDDKPVYFTKTELAALLGFAKQNVDDAGIVLILHLLRGLGIVEFTTVPYKNRMGVDCIRYVLEHAYPNSDKMDYLLTPDDQIDEANVEHLWEVISREAKDN